MFIGKTFVGQGGPLGNRSNRFREAPEIRLPNNRTVAQRYEQTLDKGKVGGSIPLGPIDMNYRISKPFLARPEIIPTDPGFVKPGFGKPPQMAHGEEQPFEPGVYLVTRQIDWSPEKVQIDWSPEKVQIDFAHEGRSYLAILDKKDLEGV